MSLNEAAKNVVACWPLDNRKILEAANWGFLHDPIGGNDLHNQGIAFVTDDGKGGVIFVPCDQPVIVKG